MAYEIIGESIKSATSIKIGEIFKVPKTVNGVTTYTSPKRYKEHITKQTYPNFHIIQPSLIVMPKGIGTGRIQLDYVINVQYRVAENTESITNLQQQLDEVGLKLLTELTELNLELPVKTYNRNYEKIDGVGQFTFYVTVFATPEPQETVKFKDLDLTENIIEEEN